jgi:hypothetical protein
LRAASTDEAMAALASGKEPETDDAPLNLITAAREFTAARSAVAYTTAATRSGALADEAAPTSAPALCQPHRSRRMHRHIEVGLKDRDQQHHQHPRRHTARSGQQQSQPA